jgi:hypothetical protein
MFEVLNRTQRGKGIPARTICQKIQGTGKTKQKPFVVDDKIT